MEFVKAHKGTLLSHYSMLTPTQKMGYKDKVTQLCVKKQQTACDNPRGVQHDMEASFDAMDQEVCLQSSLLRMSNQEWVVDHTMLLPRYQRILHCC